MGEGGGADILYFLCRSVASVRCWSHDAELTDAVLRSGVNVVGFQLGNGDGVNKSTGLLTLCGSAEEKGFAVGADVKWRVDVGVMEARLFVFVAEYEKERAGGQGHFRQSERIGILLIFGETDALKLYGFIRSVRELKPICKFSLLVGIDCFVRRADLVYYKLARKGMVNVLGGQGFNGFCARLRIRLRVGRGVDVRVFGGCVLCVGYVAGGAVGNGIRCGVV